MINRRKIWVVFNTGTQNFIKAFIAQEDAEKEVRRLNRMYTLVVYDTKSIFLEGKCGV